MVAKRFWHCVYYYDSIEPSLHNNAISAKKYDHRTATITHSRPTHGTVRKWHRTLTATYIHLTHLLRQAINNINPGQTRVMVAD